MKKVIGNYLGFILVYKEATFRVLDLTFKVTSWALRIMKKPKINLQFHFVKNGNQDFVKKYHSKVWRYEHTTLERW
jgi:hypothetical protein